MANKRKRGQNFSIDEKDKLIKMILQHRKTILNKKTDGPANEAKTKIWILLTNHFNTSATVYRSRESLMKVWEKMKSESKVYYSNKKKLNMESEDGSCIVKPDPILEQVCTVLGQQQEFTGLIIKTESDFESAIEPQLPKGTFIDCEHNASIEITESSQSSKETITDSIANETIEESVINKVLMEHLNKKPIWSRKLAPFSNTNKSTETVDQLYASFKDVNSKKEDIEDLKTQLLIDEIQHKRKLYKLHILAAEKDLEIKHELLQHIKGGGLGSLNLFAVPLNKE